MSGRRIFWGIIGLFGWFLSAGAEAAPLGDRLEYVSLANVGAGWVSVSFDNTYSDPVPVCTYVTASIASPSVIPRVQNLSSSGLQVSVHEMTGGTNIADNPTPGTVYCVIAERGAHQLADGRWFEAVTVTPTGTNGNTIGWNFANTVNILPSLSHSFVNPVAVALVISNNDPQPTAVWSSDCDVRSNPAFQAGLSDGMCVGTHIGQINATRASESIGVIVIESGSGTALGIDYHFFRGPVTIDGIGTNFNTSYGVTGDMDAAVAQQQGERGGQGSWATLTGTDPLPSGSIRLSVDEEVVAGDTTRTHVTEMIDVFAFADNRPISLEAEKTVAIWDPDSLGLFAVPGNDVVYTIAVTNTGGRATDADTLFFVDKIPDDFIFFNGDFDPTDADPDAVLFAETDTGLDWLYSRDVGFSYGATRPTSLAQCTVTPTVGYDPLVRWVCLNPKGQMAAGSPAPMFTARFRGRIE